MMQHTSANRALLEMALENIRATKSVPAKDAHVRTVTSVCKFANLDVSLLIVHQFVLL